jgi:hypothetical protein
VSDRVWIVIDLYSVFFISFHLLTTFANTLQSSAYYGLSHTSASLILGTFDVCYLGQLVQHFVVDNEHGLLMLIHI